MLMELKSHNRDQFQNQEQWPMQTKYIETEEEKEVKFAENKHTDPNYYEDN